MGSFIAAIAPMVALFLIPIAIPIVAVVMGAIGDLVRPHVGTVAEVAVTTAQARSAPYRAEMKRLIEVATAERLRARQALVQRAQLVPVTKPLSGHDRPGGRAAA